MIYDYNLYLGFMEIFLKYDLLFILESSFALFRFFYVKYSFLLNGNIELLFDLIKYSYVYLHNFL